MTLIVPTVRDWPRVILLTMRPPRFGVASVALTSRIHSHYVSGHGSTAGLIIFVVVVVILVGFNWFRRNRRS
jgi:ABC-type Fe3+ transport system permease subunit